MIFTDNEIKEMAKSPNVLRALADIHDCKVVEVDAIGEFPAAVLYHSSRAGWLRLAAAAIEEKF